MIDIDKIEEAAKRHGNDADWQGAAIAYETHVTPSVVLEMVSLIRLQEAGLNAEQARYESLSEAFASIPAQTGMQSLEWDAVNSAANTANNNFGQWMPERWLQEFVKAYNASIPVQPVQQPAQVVDMEDITYLTAHIKRAKEIVGCPEDDNLIEFLTVAQRVSNVAQVGELSEAGIAARYPHLHGTTAAQVLHCARDIIAASVQPESAPEYKEITDHNGRITGYVLSNADKMPSYSQPDSGRAAFEKFCAEHGFDVDPPLAWATRRAQSLAAPVAAPVDVPAASVQPATVTLDGHQLRMALDFINPDGLDDRDQMDNDLTFGVRQHQGDDGTISTGMCCWNDDSDGVLPLDGEYPDLAKDNCPTCGNSWADHEFAVPAPYCPEPRKATTKQPDSGRDAALVDEADLECQVPPHGWRCTRGAGHSGPCAAVEYPEDIEAVERGMERLAAHTANVAQPVSDAQIIDALHSLGVDTYPSKYGFSEVQVSATTVPTIRKITEILAAAKKGPTT